MLVIRVSKEDFLAEVGLSQSFRFVFHWKVYFVLTLPLYSNLGVFHFVRPFVLLAIS